MLQTIGNCFESISTFSVLRVYSKQILTVKVYEVHLMQNHDNLKIFFFRKFCPLSIKLFKTSACIFQKQFVFLSFLSVLLLLLYLIGYTRPRDGFQHLSRSANQN